METRSLTNQQSDAKASPMNSLGYEPEDRTWDANWMLIRKLWPNWEPTDEMMREVWFRSFDKPHGLRGAERINQDALREAITASARSSKWKEPKFLHIADLYRHERNRVLSQLERIRMRSDGIDERALINNEHEKWLSEMKEWKPERLKRAMELVAEQFDTYRDKSTNPASWGRTFTGLVYNADKIIREGKSHDD